MVSKNEVYLDSLSLVSKMKLSTLRLYIVGVPPMPFGILMMQLKKRHVAWSKDSFPTRLLVWRYNYGN
jgi:hypothetical protein